MLKITDESGSSYFTPPVTLSGANSHPQLDSVMVLL